MNQQEVKEEVKMKEYLAIYFSVGCIEGPLEDGELAGLIGDSVIHAENHREAADLAYGKVDDECEVVGYLYDKSGKLCYVFGEGYFSPYLGKLQNEGFNDLITGYYHGFFSVKKPLTNDVKV